MGIKARVALVLDYSGSMSQQYKSGEVQQVLNRIMPLALNFDDDGSFECWAFAEKALRLNDVSLDNLNSYIASEQEAIKNGMRGLAIIMSLPFLKKYYVILTKKAHQTCLYILFLFLMVAFLKLEKLKRFYKRPHHNLYFGNL